MLGILVTAEVSGGHFNPTISIAWCVCGKLPWRKLPAYLVAQFLGSALAILLLLVVYWEKADEAGEGIGLLLASFPGLSSRPYWGSLVIDQVVASTFLLLAFSSIVERKLQPGPMLMALSVTGIILSLGLNAGSAMNPSMDFCAYLVAQFLGSALAILLLLVVYWEKADEAGEGIGLLLASFPNLSSRPYWGSLVIDQVVASTFLLLAFSSIVERKLQPGPMLMALSVAG